jgi:hypothetical protein
MVAGDEDGVGRFLVAHLARRIDRLPPVVDRPELKGIEFVNAREGHLVDEIRLDDGFGVVAEPVEDDLGRRCVFGSVDFTTLARRSIGGARESTGRLDRPLCIPLEASGQTLKLGSDVGGVDRPARQRAPSSIVLQCTGLETSSFRVEKEEIGGATRGVARHDEPLVDDDAIDTGGMVVGQEGDRRVSLEGVAVRVDDLAQSDREALVVASSLAQPRNDLFEDGIRAQFPEIVPDLAPISSRIRDVLVVDRGEHGPDVDIDSDGCLSKMIIEVSIAPGVIDEGIHA